jgi:hypothetical protein
MLNIVKRHLDLSLDQLENYVFINKNDVRAIEFKFELNSLNEKLNELIKDRHETLQQMREHPNCSPSECSNNESRIP